MENKNNNPTGKGGFADNPQNRHHGAWKKEDTPRYKLEKMMKMTEDELLDLVKDKEAPYFERTLAYAISQKDWKITKDMIAEVYGTPKQTVEQTVIEKPIPLEDISGVQKDNSLPQNQETEQKN